MSTEIAEYRLPTNVKPTHYDLTVRTDLQEHTFDGVVKINLDVKSETSTIVFNTSDLTLEDISLQSDALGASLAPTETTYNKESERGTLSFAKALPTGSKATLRIAFAGKLTGSMMGYYRSVGGGETYSLTQFEPTAARRAFPCWDEPLLKATFAVTLVSRADTVSLSNMSAAAEGAFDAAGVDAWLAARVADAGAWKTTRFATSPPMSTYLVAYANGRFVHLESSYTSPLSGKTRPLRIYTTPDCIGQAGFALEVKRRVLPLYEQVFDIEFPLPKLDTLVAHDFDAGAMENWGLITGRTVTYLINPDSKDVRAKKWIAGTQCHEVAHMWFGDITTMAWWDNLYLNEGFATLMSVVILDRVFPEWKLHSAFVSESLSYAFNVDAKLSSHPIEVECPDANMVNQIFDGLSYHKAASVLRMLSRYVGEEKFLKGVSIYLKKHLFANSVTKDLWEGIGEATGLDIPKVMDNWVKKMGYPVVTVTETADGIKVRQDRFLETGPATAENNETIWTIPLSLLTVSESGEVVVDNSVVLDTREKTIKLDVNRPFKLNAGTVSFYRVLYSPERLVKIGKEAAKTPSPFSVEDRMGLVDDAFALAKAGYADVSSALSLVDTLRNEQEHLVWESIGTNLTVLRSVWWEHPDVGDSLNKFRQELFGPIVERLGYTYSEDDSTDTRELRTLAITQVANARQEIAVKELTGRFATFMKTGDDSVIPTELERVTYSTAVRFGGRDEWNAVKDIAQKPKHPSAGVAAIIGMGSTQDVDVAKDTFKFMMDDARDQDVYLFFAGLGGNPATRRFLAQAFKDNYDTLYKRLEGNFTMQNLVKYTFQGFSSDKDHEEIAAFFQTKDTSRYDMAYKQTMESIATRSAWIKRSTADVQQWFQNRQQGTKL
ncbi:hypothetical protein WOLCODRAFT_29621 [Wolfiporia cocos MD-104 SS10]|uniref:Aminopeptidase n=1 Tax=Wolfiporia cocos (strain MD-104) TaxID=742152 RepID=A0A2H3JCD5_WOLCO|nr:hypothetical protein WOLCODRAFT_29621 [Wolfiporia cocos MD-104 SS10]